MQPISGAAGGAGPASTAGAVAAGAAIWLLLCLAVFLNLSATHWRDNRDDDLLFAYSGWRVWRGDVPYLNIFDNKPPAIWYVNALGFALFGQNATGGIVMPALALSITLTAFTLAACLAYGWGVALPAALTAAALLTHVRFECGANRTETYVAACESLGACAYLAWLARRRPAWLAVAGLALGAAPCFKQSGLAAAAACGLHLVIVSIRARLGWRPVVAFMAAGMVLPTLVVAALALQGALADAWFAVVTFNRWSFVRGDASWVRVDRSLADYWPDLTPQVELYAVILAGAGLWIAIAVKRRPSRSEARLRLWQPRGLGLFWIWAVISFYLACVSTGRMAYHLAPLLTPLGLLALFPLGASLGGRPLAEALLRPTRTAAMVGYAYVLLSIGADSLLHAEKCWRVKTHWYAFERRAPEGYELRADFIREHTRPQDLIYVWGWSPGTYRFAYRGCPSRFATLEAVSHVAPYGEFIVEGAIHDMLARPPAAFVMSEMDYAGFADSDRREFAAWLQGNYELKATLGGMHVFLRREESPASRP